MSAQLPFLLTVLSFYLGFGVVMALLFLTFWIKSFDHAAETGTWGFRILILPGLITLWPLILWKVRLNQLGRYTPPLADQPLAPVYQRRIHGLAFLLLAILLPLLGALLCR